MGLIAPPAGWYNRPPNSIRNQPKDRPCHHPNAAPHAPHRSRATALPRGGRRGAAGCRRPSRAGGRAGAGDRPRIVVMLALRANRALTTIQQTDPRRTPTATVQATGRRRALPDASRRCPMPCASRSISC